MGVIPRSLATPHNARVCSESRGRYRVDDTVTRPVEGLGRTIPVGTLRITVTDGADEGLTL